MGTPPARNSSFEHFGLCPHTNMAYVSQLVPFISFPPRSNMGVPLGNSRKSTAIPQALLKKTLALHRGMIKMAWALSLWILSKTLLNKLKGGFIHKNSPPVFFKGVLPVHAPGPIPLFEPRVARIRKRIQVRLLPKVEHDLLHYLVPHRILTGNPPSRLVPKLQRGAPPLGRTAKTGRISRRRLHFSKALTLLADTFSFQAYKSPK